MNNLTHSHRQVWETIPWIVNGSASEEEMRAIREHLRECTDCREALAFEQKLRDALSHPQANLSDAAQGWQRLSARLDDRPMGSRGLPAAMTDHAHAPASSPVRWLAAAVIIEALALGAVVSSAWLNKPDRGPVSAYRTMSQPVAAVRTAPTIRVVLSQDMTLEQLHVLLNTAHLQVVAGPGESGVWSLAPVDNAVAVATEGALKQLRDSPQVRFAEPIDSGTRAPAH